jgi:hypothetical protein
MTYSYSLGAAGAPGKIAAVRLEIPDNISSAYDLEDAEIQYMLDAVGQSVPAAAIRCCKWLARKYAKMASFSADGLSVQNGQRAQTFADRAKELEAELSGGMQIADMIRDDGYHEVMGGQTGEYSDDRLIYIVT